MKQTVVAVYRTSPRARKHNLVIFNDTFIDELLSTRKRKPLLPFDCVIDEIGIGKNFIDRYKKKYDIKKHKEF
jgi:hypothetical protein